jgi:hypothetical protein
MSLGGPLGEQMKRVATGVKVVVLKDAGLRMMEERPKLTMEALVNLL